MTVKKAAALLVSAVAASAIGITAFAASNSFYGSLVRADTPKKVGVATKTKSGNATVNTSDGINYSCLVQYNVYSEDGKALMTDTAYATSLNVNYTMTYMPNCGFVDNKYSLKAYLPPSNQHVESTTVGGTWEP